MCQRCAYVRKKSAHGNYVSFIRLTKSRNTVWRPFYPLIRNNMTQNTVRDSRESPDKQENGILNRLAYNHIDVKEFPRRFLLPFLTERLVGTKYLFFSGGQICIQKKNLLLIWLIKWKRKNWLHADEFWSKINGTSHWLLYDQSLICKQSQKTKTNKQLELFYY